MEKDRDKTKEQLINELEESRKREEIRSAVFNATPDLIALIDKQWTIIDINESMAIRFGKHRKELIGSNGWNLIPKELAESRNKYFKEVFRTGKPCHFEDEREGIYFENTAYPISQEKGEVKRIAIHAVDITERKTAEKKYRTILKTALDGFAIIDSNANLLEVNDSYCQMSGYSREELLKMSVSEIDILHSSEVVAERINTMITQGPDYFETKHRRKDGRIIDVEVSSNYLDIDQGQFFIFLRDITERKKAEEALIANEERFRLIADNATDLISRIRLTPTISTDYVSPSCLRITGYKQEEFYNNPNLGLEMIHPEDKDYFEKHITSDNGKDQKPITIRLVRKNGQVIWIEQTHAAILNSHGEPITMHLIARDITERKQAEELLRESENKYRSLVERANDGICIMPICDRQKCGVVL
jgi:PAS domain S-box-containing protein